MHARQRPSPDLLRLLDAQSGCVSTEQARALGLSRGAGARLVAEGWWTHTAWGMYVRGDQGFETLAWAGLVLAGPGAVIGGGAALHLHGLADVPVTVDVWSPRQMKRGDSRWRFRRGLRVGRGEPSRLSIEAAVVDLSGELSEGDLLVLLGRAVGSGRTTRQRLCREVEGRPTVARRPLLIEVLAGDLRGVDSPMERRYVRDVERPHGLPRSLRQVQLAGGRVDGYLEQYGLITEIDGFEVHRLRRRRDNERDALHAASGLLTLRFDSSEVVGDPCGVALRVARVLSARGWPGPFRHCRRCTP